MLTTNVNNLSHSNTQEEKYSSIFNNEIIPINNVIKPTNATQIPVPLLGINYLMASSYKPDNPCSMIDTSNSSTNDIVNSEMITVNNVTGPSSEEYSSNDIVSSVLTATVNNVAYSTIKE